MNGQSIPQIEVTISPALRALYAAQGSETAIDVPMIGNRETASVTDKRRPSDPYSEWRQVSLRRDGKRPLKFEGLCVASYSEITRLGRVDCTHQLEVFVSKEKETYISMALHMPPDAAIRSLFDGELLGVTDLEQMKSNWNEKVSRIAAVVTPSSSLPISSPTHKGIWSDKLLRQQPE